MSYAYEGLEPSLRCCKSAIKLSHDICFCYHSYYLEKALSLGLSLLIYKMRGLDDLVEDCPGNILCLIF